MSEDSDSEWSDATWNPVRDCRKVSPGCENCFAELHAERWRGLLCHPYEQGFELRLVPETLFEPLRWTRSRTVYVNSMSDLFQGGVPESFARASDLQQSLVRLPVPSTSPSHRPVTASRGLEAGAESARPMRRARGWVSRNSVALQDRWARVACTSDMGRRCSAGLGPSQRRTDERSEVVSATRVTGAFGAWRSARRGRG